MSGKELPSPAVTVCWDAPCPPESAVTCDDQDQDSSGTLFNKDKYAEKTLFTISLMYMMGCIKNKMSKGIRVLLCQFHASVNVIGNAIKVVTTHMKESTQLSRFHNTYTKISLETVIDLCVGN